MLLGLLWSVDCSAADHDSGQCSLLMGQAAKAYVSKYKVEGWGYAAYPQPSTFLPIPIHGFHAAFSFATYVRCPLAQGHRALS